MSFAFLISTKYIKENTPIDSNVDDNLLKMGMREAQDVHIRDLIGSGLYNELMSQITTDTKTSANNTLIEDYIAPCMKYYVLYENAHNLSFQIVNKGIMTRNSEFQNPADINAVTSLMAHWKDKGEYYANRLTNFLRANLTTYPLYSNPGSGIDTIRPKTTHLHGGFFLGNTNECPTYGEPE